MNAILSSPWFIPLVLTVLLVPAVIPLGVAYTVLMERKVLGDMQVRLGPMRVGPHGLLQTIADAVKLLLKEDIIPSAASKGLFRFAPVISFFTAATSMAVIPFSSKFYVIDVNVGVVLILALSSLGTMGVIFGGWASNSHYSLLGGLRGAAQLVSYEVALGLALISGVMAAGTLSMNGIVKSQLQHGVWFAFENFGLMFVPFMVYFISAIAETNRSPFDLPEGESELVAGYSTEYSGFRYAIYYLAEYTAMFVVGSVAVTVFWGGWLRPFPNVSWLAFPLDYGGPLLVFGASGALCLYLVKQQPIKGYAISMIALGLAFFGVAGLFLIPVVNAVAAPVFWFLLKLVTALYVMIWIRGTFPRYRYDQLMNIGWKVMIPTALGALFVNALVGMLRG